MSSSDSRPDVVFVLSDQHRASALGCADDEPVETPNLDRLAADGTRYTSAYANSPLCAPSRASLLTGRYPSNAGVVSNGSQLDPDATTIGEMFSAAGYRTGYVGKWHLWDHAENYADAGAEATNHILSRGFDEVFVPDSAHEYFDVDHYTDGDTRVETEGYAPVAQTDAALEFLRDSGDEPTCLVVCYGPPHNPYEQVPEAFRDLYDPETIPLRPNVEPILPYAGEHPEPTPLWAPPVSYDTDGPVSDHTYVDPREGLADYYAQISAIDHEFGRILDDLDERGVTDETVVAYTSDHGDQLWSQGHGQKSVPYEESIHVPLLVRWPGEVPAGRETDAMVGLVDLTPTLCGLAGVDPAGPRQDETDGTDFSDVACGESDHARDWIGLSHHSGWFGVRTPRYTYAQTTEPFPHIPDGGWLFFDNETDPYQLENRLYDPEYADERRECDRLIDEFLAQTDTRPAANN